MAHGYVPYDPSVRRKELDQFGGFFAVWCVLNSFVFASMAKKEMTHAHIHYGPRVQTSKLDRPSNFSNGCGGYCNPDRI